MVYSFDATEKVYFLSPVIVGSSEEMLERIFRRESLNLISQHTINTTETGVKKF